tara:strand:- start:1032 stop:1445 length:414 start_codon:yes stop_codon:yes gene_type:complete
MKFYTDGSTLNNPGPSGWAFIAICDIWEWEVSDCVAESTNNRMELTAVIEALKFAKNQNTIEIYSDSQYVIKGITQWIDNWIKKDWKKVKNVDLWKELHSLTIGKNIKWTWVKAHADDEYNNRVDLLARNEAMKVKS